MSWSVNPVRVLAAYTGLFIVAAGVVCGQINQTDTSPARGIVPTGEYRAEEMGVVNAVSGALYLQVPVTRLPQNRGGQAGFDLSLLYNSGHYDVHTTYAGEISPGEPNPISNLQSSPESGWRYSYQYSLDFERRPVDTHHTLSCQNPIDRHNAAYVFRLTLVLPDGSRHLLRMTGQSDTDGDGAGDGYYAYDPNGNWSNSPCASGTNLSGDRSYYTVDGTYLNVLVSYVNGVDSLHVQTLRP